MEKANSQPPAVNCSDWACTIFRLSVWRKSTRRFIDPAAHYRDKTIRVTGKVKEVEKVPRIEADKAEQIRIVER